METFEQRLTGGHPNSLGNTVEIVVEVLADSSKLEELFNCYFSSDEVVRLRTSNGLKRICQEQKRLLIPYIDRLIKEVSNIDQASTQWTLATLFDLLERDMTSIQKEHALQIMKNNLAHHEDWIVLNNTMQVLFDWSADDAELRKWIIPHLKRLENDGRKSVANRAKKLIKVAIDN